MEIKSVTRRMAKTNRLVVNPDCPHSKVPDHVNVRHNHRCYVRESDSHLETKFYGVTYVNGIEQIVTAEYDSAEEVPNVPDMPTGMAILPLLPLES